MRFEGKVVIVTGGGQGIGETYAKSFAAEGASVVIAELNKEGGQRVANEITEAGQAAFFVETDVSSEQDAAAAAAAAQDQFGGVDILV
ncbi:MAG: SDR family NAD(P)-dependent oxidoreductase, partial [Halieaceae bacterium]